MQALKARVQDGRLRLDEPTDLPEGSVVPLQIAADWDDLEDEDRLALHRELRASQVEAEAGQLLDFDDVVSALKTAP